MTSPVVLRGGDAEVRFTSFGLGAYETFLKVKQLPEKRLVFDGHTGTYTVRTPARFAHLLDPSITLPRRADLPLAAHLFDYQAWIVERALAAKRVACWAGTGLGKAAIFLEVARPARIRTGRRAADPSPRPGPDRTIGQAGGV